MKGILVVIDMQNDFISGALGSKSAQAIVENARNKIKAHNGMVVFTRDTHTDDYMNTQEGRSLPVKHCISGTKGWEIAPELQEVMQKDALIVDKSAFGSFELVDVLKKHIKPETEIELIGIATDICVISNALILKAAFPENKIIVDSSCCAGITEEGHNAALSVMLTCQIEVV